MADNKKKSFVGKAKDAIGRASIKPEKNDRATEASKDKRGRITAKKRLVNKPGKSQEAKYGKLQWFSISAKKGENDGWGRQSDLIFDKATEMGLDIGYTQAQGIRFIYIHCRKAEIEKLIEVLGKDAYVYREADKVFMFLTQKYLIREAEKKSDAPETDNTEKKRQDKLDEQLKKAVAEYNSVYTTLNDHGAKLFNQRERSIDLLANVENLINSIANHPKEFDTELIEMQIKKKEFRTACDFAKKELESAQKSAAEAGAGIVGGIAVASLAPGAAMWIATTFGTASTGAAISTLSGAAATNAALAWLGGGTVLAGGGGMATGQAFLALAGPVGWSIAGATLLTSIILFSNKKLKIAKEKKEEIESVLQNTAQLKEADTKLDALLKKTVDIREGLSNQYTKAMALFGKNFLDIPEDAQIFLGTIVNNAKALSVSLSEGV